MTGTQRFSSVWDAIEDTPQQAASMRARSALMMNLTENHWRAGYDPKRCRRLFWRDTTPHF